MSGQGARPLADLLRRAGEGLGDIRWEPGDDGGFPPPPQTSVTAVPPSASSFFSTFPWDPVDPESPGGERLRPRLAVPRRPSEG